MATLGEIVAEFDGAAGLESLLAALQSPELLQRLETVAAETGQPVSACAREAVRAFSQSADDEAWLKLLGRLQDAPSPAAACLKEMLLWALKT